MSKNLDLVMAILSLPARIFVSIIEKIIGILKHWWHLIKRYLDYNCSSCLDIAEVQGI